MFTQNLVKGGLGVAGRLKARVAGRLVARRLRKERRVARAVWAAFTCTRAAATFEREVINSMWTTRLPISPMRGASFPLALADSLALALLGQRLVLLLQANVQWHLACWMLDVTDVTDDMTSRR